MKKLMMAAMTMAAGVALAANAPDPKDLAKRQARSVHLQYAQPAKNAVSARGSVTVIESQAGSYFCLFGWDCGYCGIQDLGERGRVIIFSVWDPVDPFDFAAKPDDVKEELRAKVLYSHPVVNIARFGGEGTGARTMAGFNWKEGESVSIQIDSAPDGTNRTAYTCSVLTEEGWIKLSTVSTLKHGGNARGINGLYSFVEDFRRDYASAKVSRCAEYGNIEVKATADGEWLPITRAVFTADQTPSLAIDAGRAENGNFFLMTGGKTENKHARLWSLIN